MYKITKLAITSYYGYMVQGPENSKIKTEHVIFLSTAEYYIEIDEIQT